MNNYDCCLANLNGNSLYDISTTYHRNQLHLFNEQKTRKRESVASLNIRYKLATHSHKRETINVKLDQDPVHLPIRNEIDNIYHTLQFIIELSWPLLSVWKWCDKTNRWFSAILSYLQKYEKWVYCFPLILRIESSYQNSACCNNGCKFELLLPHFVVTPWFHNLFQTLKL